MIVKAFCHVLVTMYSTRFSPTSQRVWDDKEEQYMVDEVLEGKAGMRWSLKENERRWVHNFVIEDNAHLDFGK